MKSEQKKLSKLRYQDQRCKSCSHETSQ